MLDRLICIYSSSCSVHVYLKVKTFVFVYLLQFTGTFQHIVFLFLRNKFLNSLVCYFSEIFQWFACYKYSKRNQDVYESSELTRTRNTGKT